MAIYFASLLLQQKLSDSPISINFQKAEPPIPPPPPTIYEGGGSNYEKIC